MFPTPKRPEDNNIYTKLMIIIKKIYVLLLLALLAVSAAAETFTKSPRHKTAVQSDHFYSKNETSTNHSIYHVEAGRPMVFLLKRKSTSRTNPSVNHITVAFESESQTHSCILKSYNDLCVIEEVQETNIALVIECAHAPCDVSWVLFQPELNKVNAGQLAQGLFTLQESSDHMVAFITCNDPENKHFSDDVSIYSSSHFERGGSGNKLHFLFANEQKGFLYIDVKEESRKCAHISIADVPKKIEFSNKMLRDFTKINSPAVVGLNVPKGDFRMDCMLSKLDESSFKTATIITLAGIKGNSSQILQEFSISALGKEKVIEISITFKKPEGDYDSLQLEVLGKDQKMTMIGFVINEATVQDVDVSQRNYFHLKKGQKISYELHPDEQASDTDQVYFILANSTNAELTESNCSAKAGCQIQLTALGEISTYLHFSSTPDATQAVQYVPLGKSTKRKIKEGESIYFRKQVKANKAFEIAVNSPNIILYASSKQKCETPDASCNERSGNYLHPFVYDPKADGEFIIGAEGLESGEFIITVIDEDDEYIHLDDGFAFSYRIEQDEEEILFKYKLQEKMDVSFNLVAPLNHLTLLVTNGEEQSNELTSVSSEGYITFQKQEINSLRFIISVKKTDLTKNKMTHFTLLASSSKAVVRLESTVAHYQTLLPSAIREYIFQFDPAEDYILNFYTHNIKSELKIMLALSNNRVWDQNNLNMLWIDRESDFLDLKMVASALCLKIGDESCEIFLMLKNQMEVQVDVSITLMMRYSIIELKDGIWQSYLEGTIAKDANFYFYPKHSDKNVVLLYSTPLEDLRLAYTLWKSESKNLNPAEWPFPKAGGDDNQPSLRTVNHVTIDRELLKKQCWPNCLVLITLYKDPNVETLNRPGDTNFKIMASNNQIQLPEKTRINLVLRNNEEKQIIIDLKYALAKEQITFYTSHAIGNVLLFANVASEKQARCPQMVEETDIAIQLGETTINIDDIKKKLKQLKIEEDENIYLCLLAKGLEDSKFSIQYVTDRKEFQTLHTNSFQSVKLQTNETKMYQIQGYFNFVAKIIRTSGYPYLAIQKCQIDTLKECEEKFVASREWGKQLVKKYQQFSEEPCTNCIYFIKFQAMEPCAVTFHLNTMNSETELKEHEIITDFIEADEQSRYSLTHVKNQDFSLNIHAIEGDIEVTFTNFAQVSLLKSTEPGRKTVHFYIPKSYSYEHQAPSENGIANFGSYEYSSTFGSFHLVIKSKNPKASATFSITYSSGQNQVKLQDGLITDIVLEPNVPFKFFYENQISDSHIYFTLSAKEENTLSSLNLTSFYFNCSGEEETKVEFHLQIPKIRKRTPNPTYLLSLPERNYFEIDLVNPTSKAEVVSLGINHQELVILPFDHEFPFTLHPREDINFLVEVSSPGFIHVQIRKCDESEPLFSYSFNYEGFVRGQFQNQRELTEDAKFEDFIKVSHAGSFYVNIKAVAQSTILAINLKFLPQKPQAALLKAGNRGLIEYELTESKKAIMHFSPVACAGSECRGIKYYSMSSTKLADLYSQLVCPSSFFSIGQMQTAEAIPLTAIKYEESARNITFTQALTHHSSFVAVKAVTDSGQEIYYRPIEVVTIWGHLSRTSQSYKLTIGCIILVSVCGLLLFVRHNARRGYRRVEESERAS